MTTTDEHTNTLRPIIHACATEIYKAILEIQKLPSFQSAPVNEQVQAIEAAIGKEICNFSIYLIKYTAETIMPPLPK